MPSKLEAFLTEKKIDRRQIVTTSRQLESLQPEDRAIRLAKRKSRGDDSDKKKTETRKPRSGRPVTVVALDKIFAGKEVSSPTRTRVLRSINKILERRKESAVDLSALFDLGKPKAEAETPA